MNINWWQARDNSYHPLDDTGGYTVNEILKGNPSSNLLVELNNHIITLNSQDNTCETESSLASARFLKWRKLNHLAKVPCREVQRPYVSFLCERRLAEKLLELKQYGIASLKGDKFVYNDLFRSKFINKIQVNLTKTIFDNGVEDCYTNFNSDIVDHVYYQYGPLDDYTYVTMIANDYGDSNSEMLETLLRVIEDNNG